MGMQCHESMSANMMTEIQRGSAVDDDEHEMRCARDEEGEEMKRKPSDTKTNVKKNGLRTGRNGS